MSEAKRSSLDFAYSVYSAFFRKACFSKYLSDDLLYSFSSSFTSAFCALKPFQSSALLSIVFAFLGPAFRVKL